MDKSHRLLLLMEINFWGTPMLRILLAAVVVAALAACSPTGRLATSFDPSAAAVINQRGSATVAGQAFLRRNDGIVVYAAGSEVMLIPKTPYSDERMQQIYGSGKASYTGRRFENDDPAYYQYMRTAIADGEGRFAFNNVANGDYYLTTSVLWMAGDWRQGGALMERVSVRGGQSVNVIMRGH